jgi:hypothetical protein
VVSAAFSTSGAEATDDVEFAARPVEAGFAATSAVRVTGSEARGAGSAVFLSGHDSVTIRAMVGAGTSGALIPGTGRARTLESGRDVALAAGRTLSDGTATEADRAVASMTCSITAGRQRVSVNVRWNRADVPSNARKSDDPTRRRYRVGTNHANGGERCTILRENRIGARGGLGVARRPIRT